VHLGAVDRDHPHRRQPGVRAQRQHLAKQLGQRDLVALDKPRDRGVIRSLVRGDHRHAMSSTQARSIARDDRTARDQQYSNSAIIIDGS
jgi:hypothetical protein